MTLAKILIVDDNPGLLNDSLNAFGYDVDVAFDGVEGLEKIKAANGEYDLIILDVIMPRMDGWTVLKNIRNDLNLENLPVLMLTSEKEDEKEITGLRFGADDYVSKPYKLPMLLAHIEALLRRTKTSEKETIDLSLDISQNIEEATYDLSDREKEILKLVAKGENNNKIAEILMIQEVTVKSHLRNIFKKLNVSNRMQAVVLAIKLNLLD